jgi:hypothetical protein
MTPEQEALIRKLDQRSEYVARNTIAGLRRLMLTEIDLLRALEKRIAELAEELDERNATCRQILTATGYDEASDPVQAVHFKIAELEAEVAKERETARELLEACKARLRHGHNDTCSLVHSWPECSCGHHTLVDAIAKAGEKGASE